MNKIHQLTSVAAITLSIAVVSTFCTGYAGGYIEFTDPMKTATVEVAPVPETPMTAPEVIKRGGIADNLLTVFHVGREVGNPETLQAILIQESGGAPAAVGNKASPVGKRSYGLMQVQVNAARSVLQRNPKLVKQYFKGRSYGSLVDEEIIALLIMNDEANVRIAAYHFRIYFKLCGGDLDKTVAAYNAGIGGVEAIPNPSEFQYVISIKEKLQDVVRPFNQKHGLRLSPVT